MKLLKSLNTIVDLLLVLFVVAVIYGIATDCPNTEGYIYCEIED